MANKRASGVGAILMAAACLFCLDVSAAEGIPLTATRVGTINTINSADGSLLMKRDGGAMRIAAERSAVTVGDTLIADESTEVRFTLLDHSQVVLEPGTQLKIESFIYDAAHPADGSAVLDLISGGVMISNGALGNNDHLTLKAAVAVVTPHHAAFGARYYPGQKPAVGDRYFGATSVALLEGSESGNVGLSGLISSRSDAPQDMLPRTMPARPLHKKGITTLLIADTNTPPSLSPGGGPGGGAGLGALNPGLYVQVLSGLINVHNNGGSQNFGAGQFGFTNSFQMPPIILPNNPGLRFTPPPSFSNTTGGTQNGNGGGKPGDVDCIVR